MAPQTMELATAIDETVQSTLHEVRGLVGVLRTAGNADSVVDSRALSSRVVDLAGRLPYRRLSLVLDGVEREYLVPPRLRTTMLRVVQEGLTNANKYHSSAAVQVALRFDDELTVTVASGTNAKASHQLKPTVKSGGYGLVGLYERIVAEGGSFESGTAPDGGFVIRARLPVSSLAVRHDDGELEWIPSAS